MAPFIFGAKNKIHIIDLQKTLKCAYTALEFIEEVVASGKDVLFVGTKRQAQINIAEQAKRCGSYFVNQRWLGGMLTNFSTIQISIQKMGKIQQMVEGNDFGLYTKKEIGSLKKDLAKLEKNLSGIKTMKRAPGAIFVIDPKREHIALKEAQKLNIPAVVLIDTNCDPANIEYPIPGNDDAIRSIGLFCTLVADAIIRGKEKRPATKEPIPVATDEAVSQEALKSEEVAAKESDATVPKAEPSASEAEPEKVAVAEPAGSDANKEEHK